MTGQTQIGTAKADASGAWSVATSQLSGGTHNFTARATDTAGNTGFCFVCVVGERMGRPRRP
ncbi:Ig-like domain-containing protein [Bradyrhizobium sp. TZ2]